MCRASRGRRQLACIIEREDPRGQVTVGLANPTLREQFEEHLPPRGQTVGIHYRGGQDYTLVKVEAWGGV